MYGDIVDSVHASSVSQDVLLWKLTEGVGDSGPRPEVPDCHEDVEEDLVTIYLSVCGLHRSPHLE